MLQHDGPVFRRAFKRKCPGFLYPWDRPPQPVDETICLVVRNAREWNELGAHSGSLQLRNPCFRRTDRHDFIVAGMDREYWNTPTGGRLRWPACYRDRGA